MLPKLRNYLARQALMASVLRDGHPHLYLTQTHHPDAVARLLHIPEIYTISIQLDHPGHRSFHYHEGTYASDTSDDSDSPGRRRTGLVLFDQTLLAAIFCVRHLCRLSMRVPAGDRLYLLPWENLSHLRMLNVDITDPKGRVSQGTFASILPRVPSLEELHADIDFFSVPSLVYLTNLTSLSLTLAPPYRGTLSSSQARTRDDEVLLHIKRLTLLASLEFWQEASQHGITHLSALPSLTSLTMKLSPHTKNGLNLWQVQRLFQENRFHLKYLHFEFKLDGEFATASSSHMLRGTHSLAKVDPGNRLQFLVHWSACPVFVYAGTPTVIVTAESDEDVDIE